MLLTLVALFSWVYRPWQLTWGATSDEISRGMPGDQIVEEPSFNATRGVTVNAPPERIWPWIVQIGYKKAGFYSWGVLDNDGDGERRRGARPGCAPAEAQSVRRTLARRRDVWPAPPSAAIRGGR